MKVKCEISLFGKDVGIEIDVPDDLIRNYLDIDNLENIKIDKELIAILSDIVNEEIRDTELERLVVIVDEHNKKYYSPDDISIFRKVGVDDEKYIWRTEKEWKPQFNLKRV